MQRPDWRRLDPPHSNYCSDKLYKLLDRWFEKVERHIQLLKYDLRQTRINAKASETRLRNELARLKEGIKNQKDLGAEFAKSIKEDEQ